MNFFVILFAVIALAMNAEGTTTAPATTTVALPELDNIGIEFAGQTPKFKLFPDVNNKNGDFVWVEFGAVYELEDGETDTKKAKHAISNWASAKSHELSTTTGTLGGVDFKKVQFISTLEGTGNNNCNGGIPKPSDAGKPITYGIDVYFVTQQVDVDIGGKTVTIPKGTIKFDVVVENWPFCKATNKLQASFGMKKNNVEDSSTADYKAISFDLGSSRIEIQMPEKAIVDGEGKNITVDIDNSGSTVDAIILLPSGADIKYDPTIGEAASPTTFPPTDDEPNEEPFNGSPSVAFSRFLIVAVVVLGITLSL